MLTIRVVSFKGQPVGNQTGRFGEAGGTIGRGRNSTLVLQDPELFISRTAATISFQAGGYIITDNGTKNPVILNGQPLGPGMQARLGDGNQIQIGGYLLEASLSSAAVPTPAPPAPPAPSASAPWIGQPKDDPLALFESSRGKGPDPFADLSPKPSAAFPEPAALPPMSPRSGSDPMAGLQGREPSIDELLDLKRPGGPGPLRQEPGAWPFGQQDVGPSGVVDPIDVMLGIVRPPGRPTVPDHGPEVRTPFAPPVAQPDPAFEPVAPPAAIPSPFVAPQSPAAPPLPYPGQAGAAPMAPYQSPAAAPPASYGVPPGAAPAAPYQSPPAAPSPYQSPPAAPPAYQSVPGGMPGAPPQALPARPASGAGTDATEAELLHALLKGAGLEGSPLLRNLTPETMENVGSLLREAAQGTLDLLRARGLMKSEMRADVTVIQPIENNPLKFSPTVEAALAHLLAPHVQGFLPPVRAMKEAYDDLRAHQLGFLAGMRAALDDVLGRFAPAELEKRLSDPSVLDSLLPMNRRAKQWDLFVERYEDVVGEARENFNAAFGKAFLRAYEAQVKHLRTGGQRPG